VRLWSQCASHFLNRGWHSSSLASSDPLFLTTETRRRSAVEPQPKEFYGRKPRRSVFPGRGKGFTTDFTDGTDKIPLDQRRSGNRLLKGSEIFAQSSAEASQRED
jgi:hypothetical protein